MPLELQEIDVKKDFPTLAKCLYESYEEPLQRFFHVWFPIFGSDQKARQDSLDEAAKRLAAWHAEDPTSHWRKVIDTDTGEIAGASLWNIHHENPFAQPHDMEVTWFPNNGARRFAEQMIELHNEPRSLLGQRPQVYLFIIFTHPDYRRRGVGQQLMSWGMKQADEMGVEMFLDATPLGKALYDANGFQLLKDNLIVPHSDTPDAAWKEVEEKVGGPIPFSLMWRPIGGKYDGESIAIPPNSQ
ncbi:acyl-CoA N-acyltransferase [Xylariaceae sp. FL1019]|nr:acyl-CoA N-acyltransferase [Xylariaceae sp. FL1019]